MLSSARGSLVAISARDFERAVSFYKQILGLPMTFRHQNTWAEFHAPGLSIGIEAAGDGSVAGGGTISLCFEVSGIESIVERLRNRGVSFLGEVRETFRGKEAYFADSEGNPIKLHQSVSQPDGQARVTKQAATKASARGKTKSAKRAQPAKAKSTKARATKTAAKTARAASPRGGASRRTKR